MPAGTSAALAGAAAAQAAIAAAEAHQARVTACMKFMPGYQHDTASVARMHEYASCVDVLYPTGGLPDGVTWALKAAIVIVLACMCIGAWRGDGYGGSQGIGDRATAAVMWGVLAALFLLVTALIVAGVTYVIH